MSSRKQKLLTLLVIFFILFSITGCFDLGDLGGNETNTIGEKIEERDYEEYYKKYYDAFEDIYLISQDKSEKSYSLKDSFFNKTTVDEMKWEDDKYSVSADEYIAMYFEVNKDMYIDDIALYVKMKDSEDGTLLETVQLNIYMYIVSSDSFDDILAYDDTIEEGHDYDIKNKDSAISSAIAKVKQKAWTSFTLSIFTVDGERSKKVKVKDGDFILISFYNNTAYGKKEELKKVSFTCINLLIRGIYDEGIFG